MNDSRTLIYGEERYVDFLVCSRDPNESVVVTDASYQLIDHRTGKTESEGACLIKDRCLRVLLRPNFKGIYHLIITAVVPPETIKGVMDVVVKEAV